MKRRTWIKSVAAAGGVLSLPLKPGVAEYAAESEWKAEITRLQLRHTWTTTMSSSAYRDTLQVRLNRDNITGIGEGAPIVRYKENAREGLQAFDSVHELLTAADPWKFQKLMSDIFQKIEGQHAAKAAIDIALMDWIGKKLGIPLYRYFGLDAGNTPITTFSIGIDTPEITKQKVREAEAFPVLKIKVGLDSDEQTIAAVRSVTKKPLRVDANEGWKNKEEAVRKINWLESQGVEFVEQPMPAEMIEETRWIRKRVHLPLIADESCLNAAAVPGLINAFDGVNVKLDKCGGIQEALRAILVAKALGMKTMLGCMVSTSVSVTAAAHLSPLVDYADLDGNLLISNDPFRGVIVREGRLVLPSAPGLGVTAT